MNVKIMKTINIVYIIIYVCKNCIFAVYGLL